jgi:hypothetical protein
MNKRTGLFWPNFSASGLQLPRSAASQSRTLQGSAYFWVFLCSFSRPSVAVEAVGNVVIPKGFPRSVGRVESWLLGFPCSILCRFHGLLWKRVSQSHNHREGLLSRREPLVRDAGFTSSGLDCQCVIAEGATMQQLVLCSVARTEVK